MNAPRIVEIVKALALDARLVQRGPNYASDVLGVGRDVFPLVVEQMELQGVVLVAELRHLLSGEGDRRGA